LVIFLNYIFYYFYFFFSSRRRHTIFSRDWSSDVCSSDLFKIVFRRSLLIVIFNLMMIIPVYFVYQFLNEVMNSESKFQSLLIIAICAAIGGLIYGYLSLKSGLADRLFGERLGKLKRKLRLG